MEQQQQPKQQPGTSTDQNQQNAPYPGQGYPLSPYPTQNQMMIQQQYKMEQQQQPGTSSDQNQQNASNPGQGYPLSPYPPQNQMMIQQQYKMEQQQQQPQTQQQQPGTSTDQNQQNAPYPGQWYPPAPYPPQNQIMMQQQQGYYQQPIIQPIFGLQPCQMVCPYCGDNIITDVRTTPSTIAWIYCLVLILLLCCFFAWIPLCMESCKAAEHTCPNCHRVLGRSEYRM